MIEPIAIRSLQCPDHAINIPPTVLAVQWFVGKRCNYDCTYCSPHVHDAISDFVDRPRIFALIDSIQQHAKSLGKKIKWTITGGEPFLDPSLLSAVIKIKKHTSTDQINITTNGSLPFYLYDNFLPYLTGITVSLHLERSTKSIQKTISLVEQIQKVNKSFVSVNVMFLPGKLEWVRSIIDYLKTSGVPHVLRKIHPPMQRSELLPWTEGNGSKKDRTLLTVAQQSEKKLQWKANYNISQDDTRKDFYSQQELDFIAQANTDVAWNNVGVWTKTSEYHEINTDLLVSTDQNSFTGWQCWAGVDSLYIDYDQKIYRGTCLEGGAIETNNFVDQPTTCSLRWCVCNTDIAVRKCQNSDQLHLVNP